MPCDNGTDQIRTLDKRENAAARLAPPGWWTIRGGIAHGSGFGLDRLRNRSGKVRAATSRWIVFGGRGDPAIGRTECDRMPYSHPSVQPCISGRTAPYRYRSWSCDGGSLRTADTDIATAPIGATCRHCPPSTDQSLMKGDDNCRNAVGSAELVEQIVNMKLHGLSANAEHLGYF